MAGQKEMNFYFLLHIVNYQRVGTTDNFYSTFFLLVLLRIYIIWKLQLQNQLKILRILCNNKFQIMCKQNIICYRAD